MYTLKGNASQYFTTVIANYVSLFSFNLQFKVNTVIILHSKAIKYHTSELPNCGRAQPYNL